MEGFNKMAKRRRYFTKTAILLSVVIGACALPQKGRLLVAELPKSPISSELRPSLAVQISFLPPSADAEQNLIEEKLIEEMLAELDKTTYFRSVSLSADFSDIHMTLVLAQSVAMTSKQFGLYLATGGLSPVRVPCLYELQAEIHVCRDKVEKYEIHDEASKVFWAPGWPPYPWSIDATSSSIRTNLYRTLVLRMHADGLIRRCDSTNEK